MDSEIDSLSLPTRLLVRDRLVAALIWPWVRRSWILERGVLRLLSSTLLGGFCGPPRRLSPLLGVEDSLRHHCARAPRQAAAAIGAAGTGL